MYQIGMGIFKGVGTTRAIIKESTKETFEKIEKKKEEVKKERKEILSPTAFRFYGAGENRSNTAENRDSARREKITPTIDLSSINVVLKKRRDVALEVLESVKVEHKTKVTPDHNSFTNKVLVDFRNVPPGVRVRNDDEGRGAVMVSVGRRGSPLEDGE